MYERGMPEDSCYFRRRMTAPTTSNRKTGRIAFAAVVPVRQRDGARNFSLVLRVCRKLVA